ncbi:MAG: hypothetical protein KatS3mg005_1293 [Bryobacteraceae bacterium]|nr:MAG: hypothetical protein KatS3mg005_1293 [Bryobacteraceae bacterium]
MKKAMKRTCGLLLGLALWAGSAWGQGILITVREGEISRQIANGTTVEFAGKVGEGKDIFVELQYLGAFRAELGEASLTGSGDFRLMGVAPTPRVLQPREKVVFEVRFEPSSSRRSLAQLGLLVRELPPPDSNLLPGAYGLISVGFTGTAPELKYAFVLAADGNVQPLADGGLIRIAKAPVNQATFATVLVFNEGTATGKLESVQLEGAAELSLNQVPLMPATLGAGQGVQFRVRYEPKDVGEHAATLRLEGEGRAVTVRVEGASQGPKWTYEVLPDLTAEAGDKLLPDGVVDLGEVELGKRKRVWIRVRNTGNEEGVVAGVAVSGAGYALVDPPLAQTLVKTGGELWFGVQVTGVQTGRQTGRLRVGADGFLLTSFGFGAILEYSYVAGGVTVVESGGQVAVPAAAIGQTTAAQFVIRNTGNRGATIGSIGVSGSQTAFQLASVPVLPLVIEPDERAEFRIEFTPKLPGLNTAVLNVGPAFFNLTGTAAALPELPGFRWEGASGIVAPFTQPSVGLTLQSAYPLTLRGTVVMTVDTANFGADAAVQFSTGGRSVSFVIPAGQTRAVFSNGSTTIRLQTGTAAGRIVLTPSFVAEGGIDRTPERPVVLELTVPEQAPVLLAARVEAGLTALNVIVTGYTTTRNLTKVEVTVRRKSGRTETFSFDVAQAAQLWFGSGASLTTGGLFSATVPFGVSGTAEERARLLADLEGVTVKVSNERGTSAEISAPVV